MQLCASPVRTSLQSGRKALGFSNGIGHVGGMRARTDIALPDALARHLAETDDWRVRAVLLLDALDRFDDGSYGVRAAIIREAAELTGLHQSAASNLLSTAEWLRAHHPEQLDPDSPFVMLGHVQALQSLWRRNSQGAEWVAPLVFGGQLSVAQIKTAEMYGPGHEHDGPRRQRAAVDRLHEIADLRRRQAVEDLVTARHADAGFLEVDRESASRVPPGVADLVFGKGRELSLVRLELFTPQGASRSPVEAAGRAVLAGRYGTAHLVFGAEREELAMETVQLLLDQKDRGWSAWLAGFVDEGVQLRSIGLSARFAPGDEPFLLQYADVGKMFGTARRRPKADV